MARPLKRNITIGVEVAIERQAGVPWKVLEHRYGLNVETLRRYQRRAAAAIATPEVEALRQAVGAVSRQIEEIMRHLQAGQTDQALQACGAIDPSQKAPDEPEKPIRRSKAAKRRRAAANAGSGGPVGAGRAEAGAD